MTVKKAIAIGAAGVIGGRKLTTRIGSAVVAILGCTLVLAAPAAAALAKPSVPKPGQVYLGAWVNPAGEPQVNGPGGQELAQLAQFDAQAKRKMAILHVYTGWKVPAPLATMNTISNTYHAVPLLDWTCGDLNSAVAIGKDDQLIANYAKALKNYGKPVFLRWYWEMNLANRRSCMDATNNAAHFVAAWRHIWTIFRQHGATNVAFVWCPEADATKHPYAGYFPGARYVDWMCGDAYSHAPGHPDFTSKWAPFYKWAQTVDPRAPIMVGETGEEVTPTETTQQNSQAQAAYLASALKAISAGGGMTAIKAFVYFDAHGPAGNWVLQPGAGFNEFDRLGRHFTFGESH
jgi:hypothetical protein